MYAHWSMSKLSVACLLTAKSFPSLIPSKVISGEGMLFSIPGTLEEFSSVASCLGCTCGGRRGTEALHVPHFQLSICSH